MRKRYFRITPYILTTDVNYPDKYSAPYEDMPLPREIKNNLRKWLNTFENYLENPGKCYNINGFHRYALNLKKEMQEWLGDEWKVICCSKKKIIEYLHEELVRIADYNKDEKKYPEAIEYYLGSLNLFPGNIRILFQTAFCYYQSSQFEKACGYLKNIIEIDSFNAPSFYNLGLCYCELNDQATAGIYFEKANNIKPEEVDYTVAYAHNLIELGLHEKAIGILLSATKRKKKDKDVLEELAYAYFCSEYYLRAIELLQILSMIYPNNCNYPYKLGNCFCMIKEYEKSSQYFRKTLEMSPDFGACYFCLARNYHFMSQDELAVDMYLRALLKDKKYAEYFWEKDKLIMGLSIPSDLKESVLVFGSEYGDQNAKIALESSGLFEQSTN